MTNQLVMTNLVICGKDIFEKSLKKVLTKAYTCVIMITSKGTRVRNERKVRKMMNFFKKLFHRDYDPELLVYYRWIDEEEVKTTNANSCGLAWMEADPCLEVLKVERLG